MNTLKYSRAYFLPVFIAAISTLIVTVQPVSAESSLSQKAADMRVSKEKPSELKIQQASKELVYQIKKEINKETPDAFRALLKSLESDKNLSFNLTYAIGSQNKNETNILLKKATRANMNVDYTDSNSDILRFKLCATTNGVRHCFPSQRNSMKCPRW